MSCNTPCINLPRYKKPKYYLPKTCGNGVVTVGEINALVIEALYLSIGDSQFLPVEYRNIVEDGGHECNQAQFSMSINNVPVGLINMNNVGNAVYPYNNDHNTPAPLVGGIWNGSGYARYSRIDVTLEQAREIIQSSNSSTIALRMVGVVPNPHSNITWLRICKKRNNTLEKIVDTLAVNDMDYYINLRT